MALKLPDVPHLAGRDAALREFGFRPHEAAWLTLVCLHSGFFTRTQFTEHHRCSPETARAFVRRLIDAGVAREHPLPGAGTRLRYTHVYDRRLYRALDIEHVRHRRVAEDMVLFRRLLSFDHVIRHPRLPWLATEAEKVAYFEAHGVRRRMLPSRIYGGAARRTRRYFALNLPIAADDRSATFVYADPGRETDTELCSWAASHRQLWVWLRALGTEVHVAGVARTLVKQHALSRRIAAWANSPAVQPLTPQERETMAAITAAIRTGNRDALAQWGGFNPARRILIPLRKRADLAVAGTAAGSQIDSYSTHHAQHLGPLGLA
ncbi:MAG: hypothetical protein OXH32_01640 [Acidobacteria bacterium]|nr:hypothetical protein [Acidobacteriota bacterium]